VVSGNNLYVVGFYTGTIGEYNATTGAAINSSFVSGLSESSYALALSGNDLFVVNQDSGVVGEYNATTGAAINASLVTDGYNTTGMAVSGNNLYLTDYTDGKIGEYNATTGDLINSSLISDLSGPVAIVATPEPSSWAIALICVGSFAYLRFLARRARI